MNKLKTLEGIVGVLILSIILVVIIWGPQFSSYRPNDIHLNMRNLEPNDSFYLGTDQLGRCIFSRIVYGTRYSIGTAVVTLTLTFVFSIIYGFLCGYVGGWIDVVLTGICDLSMAFPPMVIVLSLIDVFDSNVEGLMFAIILASWPWYAKIIRSVVITEKSKGYVTAAHICGSSHFKIVSHHIFPNILNTIVVMYFTGISSMILMISGFSYLGIGFSQEIPEWGTMLTDAKKYMFTRPELLIVPGLCIFVTALGFNLVGESMRNGEV